MQRIALIGTMAAAVLAAGCSDSTPTQASTRWSGAVITVAAHDPNAHGELRGVVLDSAGALDPSHQIPIPGVTVVLNHTINVPADSTTSDTATITVTKVGEVVTDANGRFLVSSIPEGDYFILATPPESEPYFPSAAWGFASSGSNQGLATIYLPHKP
jgi:hypothetical protein